MTQTAPGSLLGDLVAVFGEQGQKAHSDVLCARLAERWPDRYTGWSPATLATAVKPHGLTTRQTWAPCLDGTPCNHSGLHRETLVRVLHAESRAATSVVYFVERDGFIKIGTTVHLADRLRAISKGGQMPEGMTVGPVQLLAVTPGDRNIEAWIHERFDEYRLPRTEWFYPSPGLLEFVRWLNAQAPARHESEAVPR